MKNEPRELLNKMFSAAVEAAQPSRCIAPFLPPPPKGRTIVIGAGKASASMASALEKIWPGELTGMVVTRYGYAVQCGRIEIVEAAHPVPDINGLRGTRTILDLVSGLTEDDLVICLMSGGASSLLSLPLDPLTLEEKKDINRALLNSGAAISEINCVRRHLSAVKGGRLAAACYPAQLLTLLISDVPGDSPVDIGSGPTVADPSTCADALNIIRRYGIAMPLAAMQILESGAGESIKPGNPSLASSAYQIITAPQIALEAAAEVAKAAGIPCYILSDRIEGEARDVGKVMAGMALQVARRNQPFKAPCILLSGGETTVSVKGDGRGGRNVEFLLSFAIALEGEDGVHAIACDTDGVDGRDEIAGAFISPNTLDRAWKSGMNPQASLDNNDGHTFFGGLGDSVICGPTLTNVNDFRAVLVLPKSADHQQEN
ncbi:glycerate kinase [Paraburkholderia sp. UCT2]|uniref:glycerate kinase type-2 family protein n=1 Tax=Paraburkholderia sp. UCT2 TaxID=2615208 RepID=UPI0016561F73|nr:glycerate kinase [Paraburkholderia sp. UCT2]MBC8728776.1 glycerate kinase [Paraburkholderia sp. UCT2]